MTSLYPSFPERQKIIHSNTLTTSKRHHHNFLLMKILQLTKQVAAARDPQSCGALHLFHHIIFQDRRTKTFRQLISKINDEHCPMNTLDSTWFPHHCLVPQHSKQDKLATLLQCYSLVIVTHNRAIGAVKIGLSKMVYLLRQSQQIIFTPVSKLQCTCYQANTAIYKINPLIFQMLTAK